MNIHDSPLNNTIAEWMRHYYIVLAPDALAELEACFTPVLRIQPWVEKYYLKLPEDALVALQVLLSSKIPAVVATKETTNDHEDTIAILRDQIRELQEKNICLEQALVAAATHVSVALDEGNVYDGYLNTNVSTVKVEAGPATTPVSITTNPAKDIVSPQKVVFKRKRH